MHSLPTIARRNLIFAIVLPLILSTCSCKETDKREAAEQGVAQFHSEINSEQYHAIYIGADEKFRAGSNESDFSRLMLLVHRKLGRVQQSELQSYKVGWFAGEGSVVTLFYNTQFTNGTASEKFIWRIKNNQPILVGYYIKSDVLNTK